MKPISGHSLFLKMDEESVSLLIPVLKHLWNLENQMSSFLRSSVELDPEKLPLEGRIFCL